MKSHLVFVLVVIVLASCSTPKYTYKFDYHDYNAGRKEKQAMKEVASNPGPVEIQPEMLVAEAPVTAPAESSTSIDAPAVNKTAPVTMTKAEKKEMIKEFKAAVKKAVKTKSLKDVVQTDQSAKAMDYDLKMALVFLVVSIVASAFYGVAPWVTYIVGTVAFIIAVVFFIKWLMKQ
jgi:hypothetical protein